MGDERCAGHRVEHSGQLRFVQVVEGLTLVVVQVEDLSGQLEAGVAVDAEGSEHDEGLRAHAFVAGFRGRLCGRHELPAVYHTFVLVDGLDDPGQRLTLVRRDNRVR
jgi:hypothetical protein